MSLDTRVPLAPVENSRCQAPPGRLTVSAAELTAALGLGTSLLVGRYRVDLASGDWWWSDEIYTMHGWKPHEVEPGPDVLLARKHPDDRARVLRAASEALRTGIPFACAHRIVDKNGRAHSLVVTGQGRRTGSGGSPEVAGYVVDVTPFQTEALNRRSKEIVNQAFVSQAVIEQAKGVIMAVCGADEAAAEHTLRETAGAVGITLRAAADQVMAAMRAEEAAGVTPEGLTRALDAVSPVGRPRSREPLLTRRKHTGRPT
ncbi:PAS and ANTAR domain-containing protein [Promicromonospora sp. MEB111]|uniref:PAS and ANTAR domain-containing protein n=1 Tax=Promicromonospora sp. MEB111 TaxID=3040301 RepID=UPI00254DE356|nr:PAS and ANTAR domain-containing protein [Promicromonospora sp. MEB111]